MRSAGQAMADKILIPAIPLAARVGCSAEERREPQQILVDLEIDVDTAQAAAADSIDAAVDYVAVRAAVEEVAAAKAYSLIETIAERTAAKLLAAFRIDAVLVRVRKPSALARFGVPWTAVEIRRSRDA